MQDIVQWMIELSPPISAEIWCSKLQSTKVSDVIGRSLESRSLWIAPATAPLQVIAHPLSSGIHRWLVEGPSGPNWDTLTPKSGITPMILNDVPVEYRLCTQTDVLQLCASKSILPENIHETTLKEMREKHHWTDKGVICVSARAPVLDSLKALSMTQLDAVAVVSDKHGVSSRWTGTLASSELNDPETLLKIMTQTGLVVQDIIREETSPLRSIVIDETASFGRLWNAMVSKKAHRAWVVNSDGNVVGVITLTDLLKLILK
jgi:CBS domain-containing protein